MTKQEKHQKIIELDDNLANKIAAGEVLTITLVLINLKQSFQNLRSHRLILVSDKF